MKTKWFSAILALVLLAGSVSPAAGGALAVASTHKMATFLQKGPQAIPSNITATTPDGVNYGVFTCQVVGLSGANSTCYNPYQMRHAYGIDTMINAGLTGKGYTIVIIDAFQSPRIKAELRAFDAAFGLPSLNGLGLPTKAGLGKFTQVAPDGLTPFDSTNSQLGQDMQGWAAEISLDVEWAHAIAPGANIVLDLAKSDQDADILSATQYAIDNNLGNIISMSFGENESCVDASIMTAQHNLFVSAAAKNITLFASSGDDGATQYNCDGTAFVKAASSPASDPLVTAVGGTTLYAARYCKALTGCTPAPGTYKKETAWNETALLGLGASTGGGYSVLYAAPYFQQALVPSMTMRGVPDVALNAAVGHGVLTYLSIPGMSASQIGFYLFGGTSASAPEWAGILAIADQKAKRSLGYINPTLYQFAQVSTNYTKLYHDILDGTNTDNGIPGFPAAAGWDPTTGLGSPKANLLIPFLAKYTAQGLTSQAIEGPLPNVNQSGPHQVSH
jgi:subtilase family serine protease